MSSFRLVQFTDTHLFADPAGELRGIRTRDSLEACIAHAGRRALPADLVLLTGDLVHDDADGYTWLERTLGPLGAPVLLIPGNHDVPDELSRRLARRPFQIGGTFAIGRWIVLLLDTWFRESVDGEGCLGEAQLATLETTLEAHAGRPALVCLHHPPIGMEAAALDALGLLDGNRFMQVIARHAGVRGVVWGHAHQSLDVYRGDVRYMCTPSTCVQFRPRWPQFEVDDRPPGYRVVDLHADGGLSSEVLWLEGYGR